MLYRSLYLSGDTDSSSFLGVIYLSLLGTSVSLVDALTRYGEIGDIFSGRNEVRVSVGKDKVVISFCF